MNIGISFLIFINRDQKTLPRDYYLISKGVLQAWKCCYKVVTGFFWFLYVIFCHWVIICQLRPKWPWVAYKLGVTIDIWHPCRVSTRNNFPERGLSLEGIARGRQSSLGEVIPGGNPTGMSYLLYYTEQIPNTKGGKITNTRDFG